MYDFFFNIAMFLKEHKDEMHENMYCILTFSFTAYYDKPILRHKEC